MEINENEAGNTTTKVSIEKNQTFQQILPKTKAIEVFERTAFGHTPSPFFFTVPTTQQKLLTQLNHWGHIHKLQPVGNHYCP